jgi:hypothetical protein
MVTVHKKKSFEMTAHTFEVAKTYGGYTVEHRTACFVTFEGCLRRKIAVVDGVEQVSFPATERVNGAGQVVESTEAFTIAAFVAPSDVEVYSPVTTDDDPDIIITNGINQYKLVAVDEATKICVLEKQGHREIGYEPPTLELHAHTLQAIIAKPVYQSVIAPAPTPAPSPIDPFWAKYKFQAVPNFKPETVEAYKANTDLKTFTVGQTYEDMSGFKVKVTSRAGDTLECESGFGSFSTHILVDDSGEFFKLGGENNRRVYAVDTPAWFYGSDDDFDPEFERDRLERSLDRDNDFAANNEVWSLI